MFNKLNIANMVFEGVSRSISVAPKYCTKIKHKNSPCDICYTVCPAEAISVGAPGETVTVDWDKCCGCGICVSQCPAQCYKLRHGGYKTFMENCCKSISPRGELVLACAEYGGFSGRAAAIECAGILNMTDFLALYLRGARKITVKFGLCSECGSKYGGSVLEREVKLLEQIGRVFQDLNDMEIVYESDCIRIAFSKQYPVFVPESDEKPNPALNRRGIFSYFKNTLKEAALKSADMITVEDMQDRTKIDFSHELTARRKLFLDSIMQLGNLTETEVDTGRNFNDIAIDESCVYCGMCARFCNTGALEINDERSEITFNPSKCISCGLCERACYHNKLHYKPTLDLRRFFSDNVLVSRKNGSSV